MMLAPLVLAASLGQVCPAPPGRYGPPPCAAHNVPGCLPGYRAQVDQWGRTTYVCDPAYWQQQQQSQAQAYPQGAPPAYAPPPPGQVPPPPAYAPPPTAAPPPAYPPPPAYAQPAAAPEHRGLVGLVLMPGGTSLHDGRYLQPNEDPRGSIAFQLEMRPFRGGSRFRLGYEYLGESDRVAATHVVDFSFKYDIIEGSVSPFFSLGVGGAAVDSRLTGDALFSGSHVWRGTLSVSGGLDFYLSQNVFITAEVKQRWMAQAPQDPVQLSATSLFGGLGFYF